MNTLTMKIYIKPEDMKRYRKLLTEEPKDASECLGLDETITYTANFGNGIEMDIKICGVEYREGESNLPWTEAVLFKNGSEVVCTECSDSIEGPWQIEYKGIMYEVSVEEARTLYSYRVSWKPEACGDNTGWDAVMSKQYLMDVYAENSETAVELAAFFSGRNKNCLSAELNRIHLSLGAYQADGMPDYGRMEAIPVREGLFAGFEICLPNEQAVRIGYSGQGLETYTKDKKTGGWTLAKGFADIQ